MWSSSGRRKYFCVALREEHYNEYYGIRNGIKPEHVHENFGIPSRWNLFSTSSTPFTLYQDANTPSDTAATPQLLRGVFASKMGCCCFDRWNARWNLHNEEARGVWMEFVRKFHAQGICKEVTSPHAQTRTTLSRTMAAAYPRQQ